MMLFHHNTPLNGEKVRDAHPAAGEIKKAPQSAPVYLISVWQFFLDGHC